MTGIIILAAGASVRLGKPKQNLIYKGQTLLQRTIETANASVCDPVIVVTGANKDVIEPTIKNLNIITVYNEAWQEGMASSIRSGIIEMQKIEPKVTSVILMLCDQPLVDTHILNLLILAKSKEGIAVCAYNETLGPPALFDAVYFPELLSLKGQEGAKKLLLKYADKAHVIPFPQGIIDIDTLEDFEKLSASHLNPPR
ncbi:MAG: molybdenum cofactor cytidylyltransferase [Mucilaginibacter sp.]|nr:molybdenum cofactor cytidylyltransferase [Mucilaginibacter sp.]